MNLCFLLCFLLFVWTENTVIKYSPGYVGGSFGQELKAWGELGVKSPTRESSESQGLKVKGESRVKRREPFPMNPT
jgi:hypothetical protein